jgi:putative serine/threonine protein kinase
VQAITQQEDEVLKKAFKVPINRLTRTPCATLLTYPKLDRVELKKRVGELQRLGVRTLEFTGEKQLSNMRVLGKGCVGIVVIAYVDSRKVALKIRRMDADRSGMQREAEMLEKANSVCVGPKLLDVSENFLLMQFIDGHLFSKWLEGQREEVSIRTVLHDVLEQCWRLDEAGLDHGELSHAPKHMIINRGDKPFIVDFETASSDRRPSNVTSVCQFLFISGIAEEVANKIGKRDKEVVVEALRRYKNLRNRERFEAVLEACGI